MRQSIIRRSLVVVAIVLLGHGFNYLFVLLVNRTVDAATFGRFYAAWATIAVLGTPGAVFALLLTRYYAEAFHARGEGAVWDALRYAARALAPWVAGATVIVEAALYFTGSAVADSALLIAFLPLVAACGFGIEMVRAAYPAAMRSHLFAAAFLIRCMLECVLGLAALALFHTVWAAYAGVLCGDVLVFAGQLLLARRLFRRKDAAAEAGLGQHSLQLRDALPFCTAYVGFVLLNNADILVAYFVLTASQLGAYSAAAILPKAIVTATQPIAQIILPILIAVKGQARLTRDALLRALAATSAMALAGLAILWTGSALLCGSTFGIRYCASNVMIVLAVAAVFLAVMRVAVTVDLGQRLYWVAHVPLVGCAIFLIVELDARPSIDTLATSYMLASLGVLVVFALLSGARMRWRAAPA